MKALVRVYISAKEVI